MHHHTIQEVAFYIRIAQQVYRLSVWLRSYFRRWFQKAVEERAQRIVAEETPKVFWGGFGLAVFVGLALLSALYTSRQLR